MPNTTGFQPLGLALSEKQIPQVVVNVANSKHRMERLEWLRVLAKQVLSQLSYTPIFIDLLIVPYPSHSTQLARADVIS